MKNDILENLRNRLANMSQEEIDADYEELKQWTNIGPSIDEFIEIQEYGYHWIQCHSMFNKSYLENKMISTEITQMIQSAMKAAGIAKKNLFTISDETEKTVFQTEYNDCKKRIDVYKMIKARYMEYETRDVEDILKKEIAKGISTGETVEEFRARLSKELHTITPEVDEEILQTMVKELRKDIKLFEGQNRTDLIDKAQDELKILAELLPAEPTEDDVLKFIHDNYPDGYTMKEMGKIIGSIKANPTFKNVDGAMCAKVVKANAL